MAENTDEGFWDDFYGSQDEAIARQFDDQPGGGFLDYDTFAEWFDHVSGSIDEATARQFDNETGGGYYDGLAGYFDSAAGQVDESVGRQFDDTPGGGFADQEIAGISVEYWLLIVVGLAVLFLVKPYGDAAADLAGGDS